MLFNPDLWLKPSHKPLESERLFLRLPLPSDWVPWFYLRERSRPFLEPWEPRWPSEKLTKNDYYRRLSNYYKKQRLGMGVYHHIILKETNELVGGLNLLHIMRGALQCASLGYWVGQEFHSNGFMTEAIQTVLPHAYETMGLHRVQAAVIPINEPSVKVLRKCHFVEEGTARKYVKINGRWQDHKIFSLAREEWMDASDMPVVAGKLFQIDT